MNTLLSEILNAREARASRQRELLRVYRCPVVCFTMNIAGPVKASPLIRRAFETGLAALEDGLRPYRIHSREVIHEITGDEAIFCVDAGASELKAICTGIEESFSMGRLFDMDVLDLQGQKLERSLQRCCLVCGKPGRSCAAGRLHSVESLQEATKKLITAHFDGADAERIGTAAVDALLEEVRTTPKPGLVDLRNQGSHRDMDAALFAISAKALKPYFTQCAAIGQDNADLPPEQTFPMLRNAGRKAETVMFEATGGINTHKGAIYTLGILCAAFGRLWHSGKVTPGAETVLNLCAAIAGDAAKADLNDAEADTAGLRLYRELGITGIRGEMARGLPSLGEIALPVFRSACEGGHSQNDAGVLALLHLIARVQDTNLYHRGGKSGAEFAAASVRSLLEGCAKPDIAQIEALDDAFIARNLSPGGCADLLAATYFLDKLL